MAAACAGSRPSSARTRDAASAAREGVAGSCSNCTCGWFVCWRGGDCCFWGIVGVLPGCVLLLDGGDGGFSTQGDEAYVPGAANKARRRLPRTILHAPLFGLWNGTLVSNHNQNNNDDNGGGGGGGGGGDSHANAHRRWRQRRGRSLLKDEARATNNSSGGGGDDSWLSADKAGCRWRFDSRHLNLKANSWKDVENSAAAAAAAAAAADK